MSDYLEKIKYYCAYQERCHKEVRNKLFELSVYGDDIDEVISELIAEDFLNEERYARSYCRGKFNQKKWGRNKIINHLKFKGISEYCIKKGLTEIDDEEYQTTLAELLNKKKKELSSEKNIWIKKKKLSNYLMQKGFESYLINELLKG